jgi:hypothetical protein
MRAAQLIYLVGVAVGLWRTDAPLVRRVGLALVWPLALAALAVTTPILFFSGAIRFPLFGVVLAALLLIAVWLAV